MSGLLPFALALIALVLPARGQQQPTFRSGVQTVSIYATVRTADGRLVPDLTRDDFVVLDNGKPQDLTIFRNDVVPITVATMLDVSVSVARQVAGVRNAARAFVACLGPGDRARIGSFGFEIAISPRLTGDRTYLQRVLDEEIWPGGPTPLWQAIDLAMTSLERESGRRVILLFTDGYATPTPISYPQKANRASIERRVDREGFMIYVVGLPAEHPADRGRTRISMNDAIRSLTVDSGGGFYEVRESDDPMVTMARVAEELHHQYSLGFEPKGLDGKAHTIEVRVKRPGMTARTRKAYVAAPSS